jgi:hypothetical protein
MNARKILGIGVVVTAIGTAAAVDMRSWSPVGEASAATSVNVSISIGTFYDRLDPYGDWIWYRGRYVWVPDRIGPRWRPYTVGHWVYTRRHGWFWASDEPFGWAAYHYGRWDYSPRMGWFWIPGRRWAPAWVAWNHSDHYVGWAPLRPHWEDPDWEDDDDFDTAVSFDTVPDVYWQVVPFNAFLSVDLSDHFIRDRDRVDEVVRRGRPTVVQIENNLVVNNFIGIDVVEEKTRKKVVVHEAKRASDPAAAGKTSGATVAVFDAEVKEDPVAKPKKIRKVEEVEKKRQARATEDLAVEEPSSGEQPDTTEEQSLKKKKKRDVERTEEGQPPAAEAITTEEQPVKKKKKKVVERTEEGQPPAAETSATEEQPGKKKKKRVVERTEEGQPPAAKTSATEEQPGKKKKKRVVQQQEAPDEEPTAKSKKKKQETAECDPATQDCAE